MSHYDEVKSQAKSMLPIYVQLHELSKRDPSLFSLSRCNKVLTGLMGGHDWSWHVIGITPAALCKFAENDFLYRIGSGITRAHIKPRIETVREVMNTPQPLNGDDFVNRWIDLDKTILCGKGENRFAVPKFIEINNSEFQLFRSGHVGWRHTAVERDFLSKPFRDMRGSIGVK